MTAGFDLDTIVDELQRGLVPAEIYNDAEVFELEKDRIFGRSWIFLAHESEIPDPGDYVVRWLVHDSFIVARDESGVINVMFNMCLHRGMQVCRAELGNTSHFRCPYHAWTYRNNGDLAGVPFHRDAYGGDEGLLRQDRALLRPARTAMYNGMVFISLDDDAPDLADHLGGFEFYLDFYLRQSEQGPEVRGPQRWRIKANWKIGAENFSGDTYHTPYTHKSIVDIELFAEPKAKKRMEGALYQAGAGGGTTYHLPEGGFRSGLNYVGYPDDMVDRMAEVWTPAQQAMIGESRFMVSAATVMPNLSFVHNWPQVDAAGLVVPFISMRQWQPIGPGECEVYSWFVVDSQAPEWFKDASYRAYLMSFGSSGMFEQDDVENWVSITQVARGRMARKLRLHSGMGLDADGRLLADPIADWPGPGRAFTGFGEYGQRAWLERWGRYLATPMGGEGVT